jgi:hypothetical protein
MQTRRSDFVTYLPATELRPLQPALLVLLQQSCDPALPVLLVLIHAAISAARISPINMGSPNAYFTPAIAVETSSGNFQAWVDHGEALDRRTST